MTHYRLSGRPDGELLLLISGLGGAGAYWSDNLEALGAAFRVLTYDQRGTGGSPDELPDPTRIDDMADDVIELLQRVGAGSCRVIGHALGGLVGLSLAARAPQSLSHLVVVNGWARMDPHTARCFEVRTALLLQGSVEMYVRAQPIFLYPSRWCAQNEARLAREAEHAVRHFPGIRNTQLRIEALRRFDAASLAAPSCRTLLIASEDDTLVPPTGSERLQEMLPDARRARLDGGHACNVTNPAEFNRLCLDFLASR